MTLYGLDFTSRPRRQKPLTLAEAVVEEDLVRLRAVHRPETFAALEAVLASPGPWLMACDFPFGLPRGLLDYLRWPAGSWADMVQHLSRIPRDQLESHFKPYREAHPPGQKYAHRATDRAASSSSSMKLVNPPVGLMLYEGAPRLLQAGITLPGLHSGHPDKIALEAYPALTARAVLGRASYKNDDAKKQAPGHLANRRHLLRTAAQTLGLRLQIAAPLSEQAIADATGDTLDAILCALQGAWAWQRRDRNFGLPEQIDAVEGWILTAPFPS